MGVVIAAGALVGCRILMGDLSECDDDSVCVAKASNLVCQQGFCVDPTIGTVPLHPKCTILGAPNGELKFGALFAKTTGDGGTSNATGRLREQAAKLAVDQLNPPVRTGIRGKSVKLFSCDTNGALAADLADNLIAQGVLAIITGGSTETNNVALKAIPAGVMVMSISATSPELTGFSDLSPSGTVGLLWRTAPSDAFQGRVIAQEITGDAGTPPKVAAIVLNDPYGQGLYNAFTLQYSGLNSAHFYARNSTSEIDTAVLAANGAAPAQGIIIGFPNDAVYALTQAATQINLQSLPWFFSDAAKSSSLITPSNKNQIEGSFGTAPASAVLALPDGGLQASEAAFWFLTQYLTTYGEDPRTSSFVFNTFDGMMLLEVGASVATAGGKTATSDGVALAMSMLSDKSVGSTSYALDPLHYSFITRDLDLGKAIDLAGASGPLDYDSNGDTPADIEVWRIVDGGFTTVKIVAP